MPDEIVSSWLVRAALIQGCDPLVLTGDVWPGWRVWTVDADRVLPQGRLEPLSQVSGIAPEAFRTATLHAVAVRIHGGEPPERAAWPWMLTLGERNTRRRGGLQYCPLCLTEDVKPYYRLQWRFAWHTGCERHACSLLDRCWNCGASMEPHRLVAEDGHAAVCATCQADLREAKAGHCPPDAMIFQQRTDQVAHGNHGLCLGEPVAPLEWFRTADFFVSLLWRTSRSGAAGLSGLMTRMGVTLPQDLAAHAGAGIETLRVGDRQWGLAAVWRLMGAERSRLEEALKESGVTRQGLFERGEPVPSLLAEIAKTLPDRPAPQRRPPMPRLPGPRLPYEVVRMMARLERKLRTTKR